MPLPQEIPMRGTAPTSSEEALNRRIREFFDQYADIYENYHCYFHDVHQQRAWWAETRRIRRLVGGERPAVLDLGCGTGNLAVKFMHLGCEVVAVDISYRMVHAVRNKTLMVPQGRMIPIVCDLREFVETTKRTFDIVAECSVLHHLVDWEETMRAMARRVRPGGVLYLTRVPFPPHELVALDPVRAAVSDFLDRFYWFLFVRMSRAHFFSYKVIPPDQSRISAHFYENGISAERVRVITREEGFREVAFRRFNDRETGILSWLDNRLFRVFRRERFQRTFYSIILQR